jgi:hypothetical protein
MTRERGRGVEKVLLNKPLSPHDTTSWITFLCGFWVMLREVNLAALFQGWKFLPDFLSLPTHSNLHWSVKHKSGIDWWDFVIIFPSFYENPSTSKIYMEYWKMWREFSREIVFNKGGECWRCWAEISKRGSDSMKFPPEIEGSPRKPL